MKKYFATAISLAILVGLLEGCEKAKPIDDILIQKEEVSYPVPVFQVVTSTVDYVDIYNYVNEEVYNHLLNARNEFNRLYYSGEISSQMRNMGTTLSQGEAEYIDFSMRNLYQLIYDYVESYNSGDYEKCYLIAQNFQQANLNKEFLFNLLVSRKLPKECQSGIDFSQYENIYDMYGNILLKDGRRLRLLGGEDDLICADSYFNDDYNKMVNLSEWYEKLPSLLFTEYASIQNNRGYDGICYVWNQTMVEKACSDEWNFIRKAGQDIYGFNPDEIIIVWDTEQLRYLYEDQYGQKWLLDAENDARLDHLFEVQDAITSGVGDTYFLDNYVKNMRSHRLANGYMK